MLGLHHPLLPQHPKGAAHGGTGHEVPGHELAPRGEGHPRGQPSLLELPPELSRDPPVPPPGPLSVDLMEALGNCSSGEPPPSVADASGWPRDSCRSLTAKTAIACSTAARRRARLRGLRDKVARHLQGPVAPAWAVERRGWSETMVA